MALSPEYAGVSSIEELNEIKRQDPETGAIIDLFNYTFNARPTIQVIPSPEGGSRGTRKTSRHSLDSIVELPIGASATIIVWYKQSDTVSNGELFSPKNVKR